MKGFNLFWEHEENYRHINKNYSGICNPFGGNQRMTAVWSLETCSLQFYQNYVCERWDMHHRHTQKT